MCTSELGYWNRGQALIFGTGCGWGNIAHEFMHTLGKNNKPSQIEIKVDN